MRTLIPALGVLAGVALATSVAADDGGRLHHDGMRHVLLVSIDGMHTVDFINCARGVNGGAPYCPNLARLKASGINYLDSSTSKPSDSFAGLMTIVTGATPRTMGVYYDVAFDRALAPTILTALGLAPAALQAVQREGTQALPGLPRDDGER